MTISRKALELAEDDVFVGVYGDYTRLRDMPPQQAEAEVDALAVGLAGAFVEADAA